jgi:hypothetical protein
MRKSMAFYLKGCAVNGKTLLLLTECAAGRFDTLRHRGLLPFSTTSAAGYSQDEALALKVVMEATLVIGSIKAKVLGEGLQSALPFDPFGWSGDHDMHAGLAFLRIAGRTTGFQRVQAIGGRSRDLKAEGERLARFHCGTLVGIYSLNVSRIAADLIARARDLGISEVRISARPLAANAPLWAKEAVAGAIELGRNWADPAWPPVKRISA